MQDLGKSLVAGSCGCLILLVSVPLLLFVLAVLFNLITGAGS